MHRKLKVLVWVSLLISLVGVVACGGGDEVQEDTRAADLAALEAKKDTLDAKRAELGELRAALEETGDMEAEAPAEDAVEAAESEEAVDPEAKIEALQTEVFALADELVTDIVNFINNDPPLEGVPFNEYQAAAIHMKGAEDALVAEEYITAGGDYGRAIRIYEDALTVDPDNADLQAGLARAQELRYMTEERFAQVKKGMTRKEVRDLIGQVNLRNVRDYEDKGVESWFYTKENGGAAGVHFKERKGEWRVYEADFDAVKPPEERDAE